MLKIKIPPRSESEETDTEPLKQVNDDSSVTQFRDWWQVEFEKPADLLEYDAGQLETAVILSQIVPLEEGWDRRSAVQKTKTKKTKNCS